MEIVCHYCGVTHPSVQSFCNGCGGALPVSEQRDPDIKTSFSRRQVAGAVAGLAIIAIVVLVISSRLSGPQQVEIVNAAEVQANPQMAAMAAVAASGTPSAAAQHKYVMNSQFTAAYLSIQAVRMMLNEYRMMEGDYPADFTALRIDPAELTDGQYVTGVALEPGGVLVASLEPSIFGNNAVLKLTPTDVMAGTRTRWDCTTNVPDEDRISGPGGIPCPFDPGLT